MMDGDKLAKVVAFRENLVYRLDEILKMIQCIIPLDKDDKSVLVEGMDEIEVYKKKLMSATTLRELSTLLDVDDIVENFDSIMENIDTTLNYKSFSNFITALEEYVDGGEFDG